MNDFTNANNANVSWRRCMKWIFRAIPTFLVAIAILSSAGSAQAKTLCPQGGGFEALCNLKISEDSGGIIGAIMVLLFIIAIITSLFFMIFGAVRYVTSAGDQAKTQQARSTIIAAVVGLVIALLAFFIVNTVTFVFTGKGMSGITIPKL